MMELDPKRYIRARLANPEHKLPFRGRLFGDNQEHPGFEIVDTFPSFDAFLLGDGSIVAAPKEKIALKVEDTTLAAAHLTDMVRAENGE